MPDVDWEKVVVALGEWADPLSLPGRSRREEAGDVLAAAARWGLEAQQRGERVEWCMRHASSSLDGECDVWLTGTVITECRMVERLLVPLEGEQ